MLALLKDTFSSPNGWDVLYSRLIANFYCSQKSILVHHTSARGKQIALAAPTTLIAAQLLGSATVKVCEPTDALGNFFSGNCGTTGFHTDDAYIPVGRRDPSRAAIVRLWMPLVDFSSRHFRFATLNDSAPSRARRRAVGVGLTGTSYLQNDILEHSGVLGEPGQVIEGAGLAPGDIFAFAGETPHIASALDCAGPGGNGCLRLILSWAGDNAVYVPGRKAGLIPLDDNQTAGAPPHGVQFPTVYGGVDQPWEWEPLAPSWRTVFRSVTNALHSGAASFAGIRWRKRLSYVSRVAWFSAPWQNVWNYPSQAQLRGGDAARELDAGRLSLVSHFGSALLGWAKSRIL